MSVCLLSHWNGLRILPTTGFPRLTRDRLFTIARWSILALLVCFFAGETFATATAMPAIHKNDAQVSDLMQKLIQMHITYIYSGYWQCDRFIFEAQEKVICAVVNEDLSQGLTRYAPYATIVHADPRASYVFPQNTPYQVNFERKIAQSHQHFRKLVIDGHVIYQPILPAQ